VSRHYSIEVVLGMLSSQELPRRVTVRFPVAASGAEWVLEYAATAAEAVEFASSAREFGLEVAVDTQTRPELRHLPCRRLWALP
jgi:hypothetical protein